MSSNGSNGEISVKASILYEKAQELKTLAGKISGRTIEIEFDKSRGMMVDELKKTMAELNELGVALAYLCGATAMRLEDTGKRFEEKDRGIANCFDEG